MSNLVLQLRKIQNIAVKKKKLERQKEIID
jgi:hypothetical protein